MNDAEIIQLQKINNTLDINEIVFKQDNNINLEQKEKINEFVNNLYYACEKYINRNKDSYIVEYDVIKYTITKDNKFILNEKQTNVNEEIMNQIQLKLQERTLSEKRFLYMTSNLNKKRKCCFLQIKNQVIFRLKILPYSHLQYPHNI